MGATLIDRQSGPLTEADIAPAGDARYLLDTRLLNLNGNGEIAQALGTAGVLLVTASAYRDVADQWQAAYNHGAATAVITSSQVLAASFPSPLAGFPAGIQIKATTALSAPANGDYAEIRTVIDGNRIARLNWGTAQASPISYGFWIYSTVSGVIFTRMNNAAAIRYIYHEHTVNAGWTWCSGTLPGDVIGTWLTTPTFALSFDIFVGGKSAAPAAVDVWNNTSGSFAQTANSTNLLGTNGNTVIVTGLVLTPGSSPPSSARVFGNMKTSDEELLQVQKFALDTKVLNINGGVEVSQELGTTGATLVTNVSKYTADMWEGMYKHGAGTAVFTSAQMLATSFPVALPGFPSAHQMKSTTALSSPANLDFGLHRHSLEGYRVSRLGLGTASAQSFSYGFWFYSTVAGTITVKLSNSAVNRCFYVEHAVAAAGWTWCQATVPGDTSGTWLLTTGIGLRLEILASGKEASPVVPGAWTATSALASTNTSNLYATANNTTLITGLVVVPGTNIPNSLRVYGTQRTYDEELALCLRYLSYDLPAVATAVFASGMSNSTTVALGAYRFPVPMRAIPTMTSSAAAKFQARISGGTLVGSGIAFTAPNTRGVRVDLTTAASQGAGQSVMIETVDTTTFIMADARL